MHTPIPNDIHASTPDAPDPTSIPLGGSAQAPDTTPRRSRREKTPPPPPTKTYLRQQITPTKNADSAALKAHMLRRAQVPTVAPDLRPPGAQAPTVSLRPAEDPDQQPSPVIVHKSIVSTRSSESGPPHNNHPLSNMHLHQPSEVETGGPTNMLPHRQSEGEPLRVDHPAINMLPQTNPSNHNMVPLDPPNGTFNIIPPTPHAHHSAYDPYGPRLHMNPYSHDPRLSMYPPQLPINYQDRGGWAPPYSVGQISPYGQGPQPSLREASPYSPVPRANSSAAASSSDGLDIPPPDPFPTSQPAPLTSAAPPKNMEMLLSDTTALQMPPQSNKSEVRIPRSPPPVLDTINLQHCVSSSPPSEPPLDSSKTDALLPPKEQPSQPALATSDSRTSDAPDASTPHKTSPGKPRAAASASSTELSSTLALPVANKDEICVTGTSQSRGVSVGTPQTKIGRPSKHAATLSDQIFDQVDDLLGSLANMTQLSVAQLAGKYVARLKGESSASRWNIYLKYYAANTEQEAARVGNRQDLGTQAFRSACWAKYQEQVSDWAERLDLFEELESFAMKGMTVAQRKRAFTKYIAKLKRMTDMAHVEFDFETVWAAAGSVIHADQGLSASHETSNAVGFWEECCRCEDGLEQDHLKAHACKKVSLKIVEEAHGPLPPPSVNTEDTLGPAVDDATRVRQAWLELLQKADPTWPGGQFIWKGHLEAMADHGLILRNYPENIMLPGETKTGNARPKGIADLWKSERDLLLSAMHIPGRKAARHRMTIEKVDAGLHQKLREGTLPVIIGVPPAFDSNSASARQIYGDGTSDTNGQPREAASSKPAPDRPNTRANTNVSGPSGPTADTALVPTTKPQTRPMIHLQSSSRRAAKKEQSPQLLSSGSDTPLPRKRRLSQCDEDEKGRRTSMRSLYDSDTGSDDIVEISSPPHPPKPPTTRSRGNAGRGRGRGRGRGGSKATEQSDRSKGKQKAKKSKTVISDTDTENSLSPPPKPKTRPTPRPVTKPVAALEISSDLHGSTPSDKNSHVQFQSSPSPPLLSSEPLVEPSKQAMSPGTISNNTLPHLPTPAAVVQGVTDAALSTAPPMAPLAAPPAIPTAAITQAPSPVANVASSINPHTNPAQGSTLNGLPSMRFAPPYDNYPRGASETPSDYSQMPLDHPQRHTNMFPYNINPAVPTRGQYEAAVRQQEPHMQYHIGPGYSGGYGGQLPGYGAGQHSGLRTGQLLGYGGGQPPGYGGVYHGSPYGVGFGVDGPMEGRRGAPYNLGPGWDRMQQMDIPVRSADNPAEFSNNNRHLFPPNDYSPNAPAPPYAHSNASGSITPQPPADHPTAQGLPDAGDTQSSHC